MKKNYVMRFAAVLLVLVLLSTCVVSGTFAKYVTKGEATDSATVAKFGVTVTAKNEEGLFSETYADNDTVFTGNSVSAAADTLAPGTEGEFAGFTITGTPEVAVRVTYSAELTLTNWQVDGAEYCPVEFTVNGTTIKMDTTVAKLEEDVEKAIAEITADYAVGTPIKDTLVVEWAWAFSTSAENDVKDTALGDAAAEGTNVPTVSLKITCTVTQID